MNTDKSGLKHGEVTDRVIRAYFDVYNTLGFGFLESVYEAAFEVALREMGVRVQRQAAIAVMFRGLVVGEFRTDILVEDVVVVELKACASLLAAHEAQMLNYLRATSIEVGLLFNFGPKPEFKRFTYDNARKQVRVDPCSSAGDLHRMSEVV